MLEPAKGFKTTDFSVLGANQSCTARENVAELHGPSTVHNVVYSGPEKSVSLWDLSFFGGLAQQFIFEHSNFIRDALDRYTSELPQDVSSDGAKLIKDGLKHPIVYPTFDTPELATPNNSVKILDPIILATGVDLSLKPFHLQTLSNMWYDPALGTDRIMAVAVFPMNERGQLAIEIFFKHPGGADERFIHDSALESEILARCKSIQS
ncbi:hypothetical protein V5O48_010338 [Marasmius crinis-equi]|uniref:Uncharacterized protein n=1 Tax=Marasmius crinis-equi TaxID=585013 RepID=A0ABR3F952_9AGAR